MPGPMLRRERRAVNPSASPNRATQADLPRGEMLRDWLGVETPEPSYYGLLGAAELETDEDVILQAARRVKRKVRAYQIGLYRKQALGLLAEVGQAVSTLTNPEKKRAYDNTLMATWREQAEALAREHLGQGDRTPAVLEAWLTACRARGVPVARLMPYLMQRVMARSQGWPKVGTHHLVLPAAVWIYRDVAVLGQCLEAGPLEKRVESVKKAQRMLGIPLGIARMVAEEVGRSQWEGERTRHSATVCDDLDEVHDALGDGWLAKELYEQAGVAAEMLEDLDKDAAVLNESDDGVVLRNQLDDAVAEALIAQAEGCCGAGRHLIIFEDGEIQYLHDSARQRIGDPEKTGEARVLWETPCAAEDAWDTATGELSAEDIREGYDLEDSDFDADGDITAEARRKVCRDWGREIVSTGLADEVLFGVDSDDTRQSILAKAAGMVDNIVIETDYMINGETCMTFNVTPGDLGHPQSMDELKDAAGRWISRINLGLCGYKAVAVIVNGERIVR